MTDIPLTDTVRFRDLDGGTLPPGSVIPPNRYIWRGPSNVPVFALENCRDVVSSNVDVVLERPAEAVVIMERTRDLPGTIPSTMHGFTRWRIYGQGADDMTRGFWCRSTIDRNNEHMEFHGCTVNGISFPFVFGGQQSKEHLITHCRVERAYTAIVAESSFQMIGGTVAVCAVGVLLTRVGDPVKITGTGFEACGRILETEGKTTASQPITLDTIRYEADQLHTDGDCVKLRHAGPLNVINSRIGGGKQRVPRIALDGFGDQLATIRGNTFGAYGAHAVCPIRAANPYEAQVQWGKNRYQRPEGDPRNTQVQETWARKLWV